MSQSPLPLQMKSARKPERPSSALPITKSLLVTCALLSVIISGAYFAHGSRFLPLTRHGDYVTEEQTQERLAAFNALGPLQMTLVTDKDIPAAIDEMPLPEESKQALLTDIAKGSQTASDQPAALPVPAHEPAPANPLRLAWITLWDTDVEDGDVVRIDSQGYSRTVVLKKVPATFAIPIPVSGTINVTGIRDGDGGGITVGVASGPVTAVFPIMSEGQSLGLKVKAN